ncbi:MAG: YjgN family protein [Methylotenera sp.]|uniref:YjgN family protein n=1 Tax=Methylotenera sp. TaxID=2051956 RepID=UPI00248A4364|nr:YjgN family protein [Methylotenera sp.]MDI1309199.1 YjgN family protein [Methylotenera sp.]
MSENQTPVVFTGKAGEYFGIWIVNLLLSIVTLGIYSAWAKVRRKKYFYNNTLVDGVGFDYHANPINILKGRIIAFVLFVIYSVVSGFNPIFGVLMGLALFLALPWIIVRGMMFNARNSSHRGLRFDFNGTYGQAIKVFIGYTLLIIVTLGLAIPFVAQRTQKFIISGHKFGVTNFKMEALVKDFYKIYLVIFIIPLLGIVAAIAIPAYQQYKIKASHVSAYQTQQFSHASTSIKAEMDMGGFIKVADVTTTESVTSENYVTEDNVTDEAAMSEEDYLKNLTPEELAEYNKLIKGVEANNPETDMTTQKKDPLADAFAGLMGKWGVAAAVLAGLIGLLLYLAVIFSFAAYMKSRIHNLVFNNTSLEHIGFFSNQRMRDLVLLYITNTIVLLFTLGLATPWAQVRMARYTANHLALTGETDWDKFVGEKKDASRALGEEIADMFDVDISFG